jgi:probable addiction module antidote protein
MRTNSSVSHDQAMNRKLKEDTEFAVEYLKAALEDTEEPRVLLIALRRITEARGGFAKVAKAAGIERESLYRALSPRGNPRFSTLVAVAKAVGLKITVEAA